ncbi:MAG TPA: chemotaxis protein CheW [Myxococcaceae bacterium]|nr:chemotaxis protein CheW [Myxococcaceae bacterium]
MSDDASWDAGTAEDALLLDLRAQRLRALPATQEAEAPSWAAELPIGQETYALPLESLLGCVPLRLVTPLPLAPPHVLGVVRFQGEIVTAFSTTMLLGAKGWGTDPFVLVVVRLPEGRTVALDCEQIPIQVEVPRSEVERQSLPPGDVAVPVVVSGPRVIQLIDVERLARRVREMSNAG